MSSEQKAQDGDAKGVKIDQNDKSGSGSTWHSCDWTVDNESGQILAFVAISHMAGNNIDHNVYTQFPCVDGGSTFTINFSTGWNYDTDWWYVTFGDANGNIYVNNANPGWQTQCNLGSSDAGWDWIYSNK